MSFIRKFVLALLLAVPILVSGASILNLDVRFEDNTWKDFLRRATGKKDPQILDTNAGKILEIPAGNALATPKFPYFTGDIQLAVDASTTEITPGAKSYHVAWITVEFYDSEGKSLGHRDLLNTGSATDWKSYQVSINNVRRDTSTFQVFFRNFGKSGVLRLRHLSIKVDIPEASALNGDPGFQGDVAVDHWHYPSAGVDWDGLALKSGSGKVEYVSGIFPDGGKSLKITSNATLCSSRYDYNGETLIFGGWVKHSKRTKGKTDWSWANLQLVFFGQDGNILGHKDLSSIGDSQTPWKYFSTKIPAGNLRRDTVAFEIWARGFEGSTGTSYFDEVQILRIASNSETTRKYDATKATLQLDLAKAEPDTIRPVWNGTDLSYISKVSNPTVRALLTNLRQNGIDHLRTREFLQGCQIVKALDSAGHPVYDWSVLDPLMDWLVNDQKFIITATMESTPNLLASVPAKDPKAFCNRSTPTDLALWSEVVQNTIEHWIERYGIDTVKEWTFECWNEPYAIRYFKGTPNEFLKIFEAYIDAIKAVESKSACKLNLGTFSGFSGNGLGTVLVNGLQKAGKLNNLNTLSSHIYAGYVNSFDTLERNIQSIRAFANGYPELKGLPIIVTEYNGSSMKNGYSDTSVAAAFQVKACRVFLDTNILRGYYFGPIDYFEGKHHNYFTGDLGIFTQNGIPKPVFGSQQLLSRLTGGSRIPVVASNEPLDALAVMDGDKLKLIVTTFDETKLSSNGKSMQVAIEVASAKPFTHGTLTQVDPTHSNSYSKWLELGSPEITPETDAVLREAAELKPEEFTSFQVKAGKLTATLTLPLNSVCYLEFE